VASCNPINNSDIYTQRISPVVLNTRRTVTVCIVPAVRSLSAITGATNTTADRPRNGRAENKPFWNHQIPGPQIAPTDKKQLENMIINATFSLEAARLRQ